MFMYSVSQSIPQPCGWIESNLVQASMLTQLSWILPLVREGKEQTWSSSLWAWRSELVFVCYGSFGWKMVLTFAVPYCYWQVASRAVYSLHKTSTREVSFSQNWYKKYNSRVILAMLRNLNLIFLSSCISQFFCLWLFTFAFMFLIVSISRRQLCVAATPSVRRFYAR